MIAEGDGAQTRRKDESFSIKEKNLLPTLFMKMVLFVPKLPQVQDVPQQRQFDLV